MNVRRLTRHVSVKDVAARSGVSFQTTSKVLNGKGSVSAATRARILGAARDLGYVPNLLARSLVMDSTRAVGLVASDFSDHNLGRCIVGAEQEARRRGYGVIITSTDADGSGTDQALPALVERRVDGILLAAPPAGSLGAVHALERNVPVVSLDDMSGAVQAGVGSDQELAGRLATEHLAGRGHRIIGTVIGAPGRRVTQSRLHGYRRALEKAGLELDPELVAEGGDRTATALEAAADLLARRPDVTAIFAQTDTMAIGVLGALRRLGRAAPAGCAVAGCDDIEISGFTAPPLTTVHVPFHEMGEQAMRLLLDMIENGSTPPRRIVLPVELVVRESSG